MKYLLVILTFLASGVCSAQGYKSIEERFILKKAAEPKGFLESIFNSEDPREKVNQEMFKSDRILGNKHLQTDLCHHPEVIKKQTTLEKNDDGVLMKINGTHFTLQKLPHECVFNNIWGCREIYLETDHFKCTMDMGVKRFTHQGVPIDTISLKPTYFLDGRDEHYFYHHYQVNGCSLDYKVDITGEVYIFESSLNGIPQFAGAGTIHCRRPLLTKEGISCPRHSGPKLKPIIIPYPKCGDEERAIKYQAGVSNTELPKEVPGNKSNTPKKSNAKQE
jgi:hypothetical protein